VIAAYRSNPYPISGAQTDLVSRDYVQHDPFVWSAGGDTDPHPHPEPPVDLIAASFAQHALSPAGAGPPQQLLDTFSVREFAVFTF
jgi:hypothetical protein